MPRIPVAFDVLGTCYGLDAAKDAIIRMFGKEHLAQMGVKPELLVEDWFHTSQRDFTYLSMNGNYIPIFKVFTANLPRILSIAGLTPPQPSTEDQKLPYSTSIFPAPLLQEIVQTLTAMTPRPSLQACSTLLLSATKFNLLAATNGGLASTRGLFDRSLPSESSEWGYFSCDTAQVAKPAPEVYENIWKKLEAISFEKGETEFKREGWFIASHTWDLFAAKKAGFKTAWVAYEEVITCEEIFGRPDIVAVDLEDAAKQIIAWEA